MVWGESLWVSLSTIEIHYIRVSFILWDGEYGVSMEG